MILGSHNSWSYLTPKKWWQKLLFFTAKCQRKTIVEQYTLGVRCFDLRLRFINNVSYIVHNSFIYAEMYSEYVRHTLRWLNACGDVKIRIIHDVRRKKDYTPANVEWFKIQCCYLENYFPNIQFWCGRNLYDWKVDYEFPYKPKCTELYSSVCPPKIIDDWIPIIYAKLNNRKNVNKQYGDNEILLIDYVDIK